MRSGDNNFNYFPEKQLIKFSAVKTIKANPDKMVAKPK